MDYFVYIIKSLRDDIYYKGFSTHPAVRLQQHNACESKYTSQKISWVLVYVEACETKTQALIRERNLKKYSHTQIKSLIGASKNIVDKFR